MSKITPEEKEAGLALRDKIRELTGVTYGMMDCIAIRRQIGDNIPEAIKWLQHRRLFCL